MATTKAPNTNLINAQKKWFSNYSNQIKAGTANLSEMNRYNNYSKYLKLNKATLDDDHVHDLSIKALSGDTRAQQYLKAMNLKTQSGAALWKGFNPATLKEGTQLWSQYMKENPYSDTAKAYDMKQYNTYGQKFMNNEAVTDNQMKYYMNATNKWNMEDQTNPYIQMIQKNDKNKELALRGQDKALNQTLATTDASNFQNMQTTQQQMAERGMGASGIAADAYARATMAGNQQYQQAYADAATQKANINNTYDQQYNQIMSDKMQYESDRADAEAKAASDAASAQAELANAQTNQDKYLTSSTGFVYLNGKQLTMNGKPVTSMEYQKLTETQRHNLATENNVAIGNQIKAQDMANDYALGADKNAIAREKIGADLQGQMAKMKLEYDKLDFNYAKLDSANAIAQDKIAIAKENAQTSADKGKITSLGKQLSSLTSQMTAYQKKGKKVPKDLVTKYNNVLNALNDVSGNFKSSGGGGDIGVISRKYESGGAGAGTIGNAAGDWGGKSYGLYQIASGTGTMKSFMSYLKGADKAMYNRLAQYSIGSGGFDGAWKSIANTDKAAFEKVQTNFIKSSHYDPVVSRVKSNLGININSRSSALQNAVLSIGVQHGSGGAYNLFKNAGVKNGMTDREIITRLYNERMKVDKYFSRSSSKIKAAVKNRFQRELKDVLALL